MATDVAAAEPMFESFAESLEDGFGGRFILDVFPKRTTITHRDSRDRVRTIGCTYGPNSADLAQVLVEALVEKLRQRRTKMVGWGN